MKSAHDIIIRPVITEAAMDMLPAKKYVFEVASDANKAEIAKAVEEVFAASKVKVAAVRTINMKKKPKRLGVHYGYISEWKKAIVTLTPDSGEIVMPEGWRCALLVFAVILLFLLAAIVFIPCLASLLLQVCGLIAALVGLASPSNAHKTHDAANVVITSGTLVLSVYLFISVFF